MSIVIGLTPGERGDAALDLGALLARSTPDSLVVATVLPTPWPPSPFPGEGEYLALQEQAGAQALERARDRLGDLDAKLVVHRARSVSSGLLEVVTEYRADQLVLGSSVSGALGRVSLGGVADRVLHTTDVPVTVAPRSFRAGPGAKIARVTVAVGRADADSDLVPAATAAAQLLDATLRVACFSVHPAGLLGGGIEREADELVVQTWRRRVRAEIAEATGADLEVVVGQGTSWADAVAGVDWTDRDLLVVGASSSAANRFFLGSHAAKIIRNAEVPVRLLPRTARVPA